MKRQTLCTRRTLRQVRTRLPSTCQITWVVLVICLSQAVAEDRGCNSDYITPDDTRALKDLIDNQALNSCNTTFSFMTLPGRDKDDRHKACYVLGAATSVINILRDQQKSYKPMSTNSNNVHKLLRLMDTLRTGQCFNRQNPMKRCYRTFTKSPADMLTMVEDFFTLTKVLLPLKVLASDCVALYDTCEEPDEDDIRKKEETTTPGPAQCKCSCPTPGSTDLAFASGKAIAASLEAIGIKKLAPTQFIPLASRQGGARVARTLQNLPTTPDSLQTPETPWVPQVSTPASTVATEALFITDALKPTLHGRRSQPTFTLDSVTGKRLFGSTEAPMSDTTETAGYQLSTEDNIIDRTESPVSVTKEINPHRMSNEEDIIGSMKGHVSVTTNTAARQSPTGETIVGSNEILYSMDIEITTHQPSIEYNLISSPESHLSLTTDTAIHEMSTKDSVVDTTEGHKSVNSQAAIHHMSQEDTRSTEDPLSVTRETANHPLSTEVNLIGTTEAPMFVTEPIIQQTSGEKEVSHRTINTVSMAARVTSLRLSSHDDTSGHSEVPKSMTDRHKPNALSTLKTERPTTLPSTSLISEDSTRLTPVPDNGRGTSQVYQRHLSPGVFQFRREGTLQSDRRWAGSDDTRHDSNLLPLYGSGSVNNRNGDQEESERRVRIFVAVPCVLGILLSICGLLYYRRQNQILRRELQQSISRSEQREEGALQRLQRDELEVEMDEV